MTEANDRLIDRSMSQVACLSVDSMVTNRCPRSVMHNIPMTDWFARVVEMDEKKREREMMRNDGWYAPTDERQRERE